jgi:hypothetical protein
LVAFADVVVQQRWRLGGVMIQTLVDVLLLNMVKEDGEAVFGDHDRRRYGF